jgi:serine/threonine-protein kinase RsbW
MDDDGREFNPLQIPPPELDRPIEERKIGGLGIHLVRDMSEKIEYQRNQGHNQIQITLKK